jgi:hypothetical protein
MTPTTKCNWGLNILPNCISGILDSVLRDCACNRAYVENYILQKNVMQFGYHPMRIKKRKNGAGDLASRKKPLSLADTLRMHFYNPRLQSQCEEEVRKCDPCQRQKNVGRGHGETASRDAPLVQSLVPGSCLLEIKS